MQKKWREKKVLPDLGTQGPWWRKGKCEKGSYRTGPQASLQKVMEGEKGSYRTVPHGARNCRKGKRNKVLPDWATGAYLQKGKRKIKKKVHARQGDTRFLIANKEKYATWLGLTGFLIVVRGKGKGSHRTRPHKASN